MDGQLNDIDSVVGLMKSCYSGMVELNAPSLMTTLQSKTSEERFRRTLQDRGITYSFSSEPFSALFNFASLQVMGTGVITDVCEKGSHPIRMTVGERVSVDFDPRDLRQVALFLLSDLDNTEFLHLKKGSTSEFRGRVAWGRYYVNTDRFELSVDSQHRAPVAGFFRSLFG
jgi:hypothetical protein